MIDKEYLMEYGEIQYKGIAHWKVENTHLFPKRA